MRQKSPYCSYHAQPNNRHRLDEERNPKASRRNIVSKELTDKMTQLREKRSASELYCRNWPKATV